MRIIGFRQPSDMTRPIKGYHVSVFFQRTIPVAVEKDQISAAVKFCKAKQIENFFKWIAKKLQRLKSIQKAQKYFGIQWGRCISLIRITNVAYGGITDKAYYEVMKHYQLNQVLTIIHQVEVVAKSTSDENTFSITYNFIVSIYNTSNVGKVFEFFEPKMTFHFTF